MDLSGTVTICCYLAVFLDDFTKSGGKREER
jgi:hypothetical protein